MSEGMLVPVLDRYRAGDKLALSFGAGSRLVPTTLLWMECDDLLRFSDADLQLLADAVSGHEGEATVLALPNHGSFVAVRTKLEGLAGHLGLKLMAPSVLAALVRGQPGDKIRLNFCHPKGIAAVRQLVEDGLLGANHNARRKINASIGFHERLDLELSVLTNFDIASATTGLWPHLLAAFLHVSPQGREVEWTSTLSAYR